MFILSCRKEKTSWNSDWVVPIINDTLSIENLVNDSTLSTGSGTVYELDLSRTILDFGIEDLIGIPDTVILHSFNISAGSLSVPPGFSIVNETEEHTMEVDDIQLKKIRVSKGIINLKVYNPVGTKTFFTVQLPGVYKNSVLFEQQFVAPAGSTSNPGTISASLDLSGYDIDLTGISGGDFNKLQSKLIVNSDPAGPSVTVSSAHQFKVEADFKNIRIDYARGYFGNLILTDTTTYFVEALNTISSGSLDIPAPEIQFEISNGLKIDARATITKVSNMNYNNNTIDLLSNQIGAPIYIETATGNWNTLVNSSQTIGFDSGNSNVESYIENLGNSHTVGYKIELNPWGNTSGGWNEIFPNSRFTVKLKAQMPLIISADGLTLKDTFDFKLDQNTDKTSFESGVFVLNASNAFPFSSDVKLYLQDENGIVLHTIEGTTEIKSALYGSIDPLDGKQKFNSEVNFILSESMLEDLAKIKKIVVQTEFNTPNPGTSLNEPVSIPVGAFLAVKLKAKLNLKTIY